MELANLVIGRIFFILIASCILIFFITKEANSRIKQQQQEHGNITSEKNKSKAGSKADGENHFSILDIFKSSNKKDPSSDEKNSRTKREISQVMSKMKESFFNDSEVDSEVVQSDTQTVINMNCYTRIEFMVLMGLIILIVLSFLTLFICIFMVQDKCFLSKRKRRSGMTHKRSDSFKPCKWWMNKDDDAKHLGELFHDRVTKLKKEEEDGNKNVKEFMQRLIPENEYNKKISYSTANLYSVNEKKLLISVPKRTDESSSKENHYTRVKS